MAQVVKSQSDQGGWGLILGIVHENFDPAVGVIGVGGTITDPGVLDFMPRSSGIINREPSEVTTDNRIYCYQSDNLSSKINYVNQQQIPGRILFQLVDTRTLKAEHQDGSCDSDFHFSSPTTYHR